VNLAPSCGADEFREVYPPCAMKIADLFTRMAAFDEKLSGLHSARPAGVSGHLPGAELTARGLDAFTRDQPSITKTAQFPEFANSAQMAWPPKKAVDPSLFAPVPYDRRYTGDWWQVKEEEAQALREQEARETAEREAKALENYHGPRWWVERASLVSSAQDHARPMVARHSSPSLSETNASIAICTAVGPVIGVSR